MDDETLEALKGSIAKWEGIIAGTTFDHGALNCPLCRMFYNRETVDDETGATLNCDGCPVMIATGKDNCEGSPYEEWSIAASIRGQRATDSTRPLAQAELDFLRSLLPKEEVE